ncbi:Homeobox protein KNOX3 [Hordeum vulgare]|nr:Homeobox protein KNOX3 [Hordeum vulgare]
MRRTTPRARAGACPVSAGGVPVPPPPSCAERHAEIARIRESLPADACEQPWYTTDNQPLWTTYFQRRHEEQLASTNDAPTPRGCHNSDNRHQWWGAPVRRLHTFLKHLVEGNKPSLEYSTSCFSRRSGSWLPRHMAVSSSSSDAATPPIVVKSEPQETPLCRRSHGDNLVINEGRFQPSPPRDHLRLVKSKNEPAATVVVKKEHVAMTADLTTGLK